MTNQRMPPMRWLWFAAVAVALVRAPGFAGSNRQCTDPCVQAARGEARDCASSASGAFSEALNGCLPHERTCLDACRADAQDCRASTSLPGALAQCDLDRLAADADCRSQFPPGSKRLAACLDRASAAHSKCRRQARRDARLAVLACTASLKSCAQACSPAEPPGGGDSCAAEAKAGFKGDLGACRLAFQVSLSACIGKDPSCVPTCSDSRATCTAPTRTTLDAALAACNAQRNAAVADCLAQNPNGGDALQACVDAAQAAVFTCREAAATDAAPGLEACLEPFLRCLRACPKA